MARSGWMPWKHLMLINDALLRVSTGELKRLIVEMPPRHGKSQLISEYASGWFVGRGQRVILASYEADFASSWGAKSRNHMREHGPTVFGVHRPARSREVVGGQQRRHDDVRRSGRADHGQGL